MHVDEVLCHGENGEPTWETSHRGCILRKVISKEVTAGRRFDFFWTLRLAKENVKKALNSPVHKLRGHFSATLAFFGNFQLVEQLSKHRAASTLLSLYIHSHAPATSETIKQCRI